MPESSKDTTEAAIAVFNTKIDLHTNSELIDRSHHLGQPRSDTDSPRTMIVKFTNRDSQLKEAQAHGTSSLIRIQESTQSTASNVER